MSQAVSISIRKVKNNILLGRKQFIVDVYHPEKPSIPKKELQKKLAEIFKISDESTISLFGFKTRFGGLRSTGFGFIYNNIILTRNTEPLYRLVRNNLVEIQKISSKQRKERKNRAKKTRGKEKSKIKFVN
jgi:small subunit ribosomal protein S24e